MDLCENEFFREKETIWLENSNEICSWKCIEITVLTVKKRFNKNSNRNFRRKVTNYRGEVWKFQG